jgi:uncharacterized protein YaaW (UPF0174 family)
METVKSAESRAHQDLEKMRSSKLKERQHFTNMMQAIKQEDELRERLRREAMVANKSQLDRQVQQNRERRLIAESLNNSMQRTFATGLPLSNDYGTLSHTEDSAGNRN